MKIEIQQVIENEILSEFQRGNTMNTRTFSSASGLVVSVPEAEIEALMTRLAERRDLPHDIAKLPIEQRTRSAVLNAAGRALKHRRELAAYYAQEISTEDLEAARTIAVQAKRESAVVAAAYDMGYGPYMVRGLAGRYVDPDTIGRIRERATERAQSEIEHAEREPLTLVDVDHGLKMMGYMVSADAEYSRRLTEPTWEITAPDGWNGQLSTAQEARA